MVLWQGLCAAVQPASGGAQSEGDEQEPHPGNSAQTPRLPQLGQLWVTQDGYQQGSWAYSTQLARPKILIP